MIRTQLSLIVVLWYVSALSAQPEKVAVKRRTDTTEEDLRKQLLKLPDVGFSQATAAALYSHVDDQVKQKSDVRPDAGGVFYSQLASKQTFNSLPWVRGVDATKSHEVAQAMEVLSGQLRDAMTNATPQGDIRPDATKVRKSLTAADWRKSTAVPTLMQLLQAENAPIRELLIDLLADIQGQEASEAIARRAMFELSPGIREKAVQALASRPKRHYQNVLLDGLRYPWPAAADHAAEAIVALDFKNDVPTLVRMLKEPDPRMVYKGENRVPHVQGAIRINHMANCMLCHAPSQSRSELVRGRIPSPGEDPPPLYYRERTGSFVRASITYLRQDFSVMQPVASPGKWPGHQRYDYVAWSRPATSAEISNPKPSTPRPRTDEGEGKATLKSQAASYPQQSSIVFALKEITKQDAGNTYEQWAKLLLKEKE